MKNKKLIGILLCMLSVIISVSMVLAACNGGKNQEDKNPETTKPQATEPAEEPTIPDVTQPLETEPTEPTEAEPTETEPEETQPEETEPEATQPSGGSGIPSVNNGTGGGYNPGTTEPTEPEDATQPEIQVPAPGSQSNAYMEQVPEKSGKFTTVSVPAGQAMFYRIRTAGAFLQITDTEVSVICNGETYVPVDGLLEIPMPEDITLDVFLQVVNEAGEDRQFAVVIRGGIGSQDNPIMLESIVDVVTEGSTEDVYYSWTADKTGILKINAQGGNAQITVNENTVELQENGEQGSIAVQEGDEITICVLAAEESVTVVSGYIAALVEMTVTEVPAEIETVSIPAGESAIYRIRGVRGKNLQFSGMNFRVVMDGLSYTMDENGELFVRIPSGGSAVELELFNEGQETETALMSFGYSTGHQLNPQILTELGEIETNLTADQDGYYFSYTAPASGLLSFQIWTYPELENAVTDIVVTNQTTGVSASLWGTDENGEMVENALASVPVAKDDSITIRVTVKNENGSAADASVLIYGELYGSEELPIFVQYPGFTAYVPAGETLYYEGYNLSHMIVRMNGTDVTISHNGISYTPNGTEVTFTVVSEGRMPAIFAITNNGSQAGVFDVAFEYPIGHSENPDTLILGTNTVTRIAGDFDYTYTFKAPRTGKVVFKFDGSAQWMYSVDNLTQSIYGDTQWSDSDPLITEYTIEVNEKDIIQIRVNTYDAANMFATPAGTVTFEAQYISGPTNVTNMAVVTNTTLIPYEYGVYTGQFYDYVLSISNAKTMVVYFQGTAYYADERGEISVEFPASDGSGTQPDLEFMVQNIGTANVIRTLVFSSQEKGSKENPDTLQYGPNVMTQTVQNGGDYYYTFTATASGRFTVTFDPNAGWYYKLTNTTRNQTSGDQLSVNGRYTYTITVRAGDVIELIVNTFDPKTGGSPVGTVEFTVAPA